MPVSLRLATGADIHRISRLEEEIFPCPWSSQQLATCVNSPFYRTWTAWVEGSVQGYAVASLSGNDLHILNLAVSSRYRGKGIGRMLINAAENWGSRLGSQSARLETRKSSAEAIGLYDSHGYREESTLSGYYPDGEDGIEFTRELQPDPYTSRIASAIVRRNNWIPPIGVVLGSGLSWLVESFGTASVIPYYHLYGGSGGSLPGHPEKLAFSGCGRFVFLLGRRHFYQGYTAEELALLPCVLGDLGVSTWVLTSSSGGVDPDLRCGDAVLLRDHVNCSGCVPAAAESRTSSDVYAEDLRKTALSVAAEVGSPLTEGVFASVSGPAYETSAELELLLERGVSSVSMSTVPEALMLSSRGHRVVAFSLISNAARPGTEVTHQEVLDAQEIIRSRQGEFLRRFLERISSDDLL